MLTSLCSAFDLPKSSDLEDSGYTSRGNATTAAAGIACRPLDPLTPSKAGSSQRSSLQKAASSNAVLGRPTFNGQTKVAKPDSVPKQAGPTATLQVNSTMEDEFWDENDKSLEIAMSQMDIPDPPSSQQGGRSQSTSALNLPVPPERLRQASNDGTGVWAPFKSRDKREREKSSDSSSGSVGKLSSKPLAAIQPSIVQVSTSTTNARTTSTTSTLSTTAKKPARTLVKSTSTSSDKSATAINVVARPAMGPTRSLSSNLMPSAGLTKAFKCPTVTNATAAKAEQDKKAATAAKLKLAGQPLPADEAWMEDMDWDGDADDSL